MAVELVVVPEAERDILKAYLWYEARRTGLGEDFLSSIDACIESIRRQPQIYPLIYEDYRRSLVRRFPYAVFFEYAEEVIIVYAIFHTSRDSDQLHQRLP